MNYETMLAVSNAGCSAAEEVRQSPMRYFLRALMGGMFLFIGVFLSIMTTTSLESFHVGISKVAGAFVFPTGLALIVMLSAQLYTGAAFTLPMAVLNRKVRVSAMLRTLLICLLGNLIGLLLLSVILVASGAQCEAVLSFLTPVVSARVSVPWWQTFLRAIICNFYIAVASYANVHLKSEFGRFALIFFVIAGFVLSGTDHSVANGAYFILYSLLTPNAPYGGMICNVLLATVGNFVGGALLAALPMYLLSAPTHEKIKSA